MQHDTTHLVSQRNLTTLYYYYHFGSANPSYSSNIILSSAKAYNRALTAAEILQNFNATRKTYNV